MNAPEAKYLEDVSVGDVVTFGTVAVDEADTIAFARLYDPQPFHTDPAAAAQTVMGGLIASGWQTCGFAMRLLIEAAPFGANPVLGTGVDELRWPAPVRPGDVLTGEAEITEVRPSASRPYRGTVRMRITLRNQRDEVVFSMLPSTVLPRRPSPPGA